MSVTLKKICEKFQHLASRESGQDLMEYGLLVSLLALACVSGIPGTANSVNHMFRQVSRALGTPPSYGNQGASGGSGSQGDSGGSGSQTGAGSTGSQGGDGGGYHGGHHGGHHGGGGGGHHWW